MIQKILYSILLLLLSLTPAFPQVEDPILFDVDGHPVHVSEFNYIYNKNNGDNADYSRASLTEYLDLYTKFKLKVRRAKDMGLDTLDNLKTELEGYRKQLSKSYLVDKEVSESLVVEVFERQKEDIRISHILCAVKPDAREGYVAEAHMRAKEAYKRLKNGETFENVVSDVSDDKSSVQNGGDLGFYTAMLPDGFYELENAMYRTEVGQFSEPVRTKVGFQIIKVTEKRPAFGETEVAHLLIRKNKQGKDIANAKEKADSIYQALIAGQNFDALVEKFSDDRSTNNKGGYLGFFGINKYDKPFEAAAFALENDGDISAPAETNIGYHIIKRISKRDQSDLDNTRKRLINKLSATPRFEIAKQTMIDKIKKRGEFIEDMAVYRAMLDGIDPSFYTYKWVPVSDMKPQMLFKFNNDISATNVEFAEYCRKNSRKRLQYDKKSPVADGMADLYAEFVNEYAIKFEESILEEKYPEFKALMREYSEGILLFEATKMNVWDKASKDTAGLQRFFDNNKYNYEWKERAILDNYVIKSTDKKLVKNIHKDIKKKKSSEEIFKKYNKNEDIISLNTTTYESGSKELLAFNKLKEHSTSDPVIDEVSKLSRVQYIQSVLPRVLKTLEESRGYVLADFQDYLESQWIKNLKESYSVNINEAVLESLVK